MLSPLQDLLSKSSHSYSLLKHPTLNLTDRLYVFELKKKSILQRLL